MPGADLAKRSASEAPGIPHFHGLQQHKPCEHKEPIAPGW